MRTEGAGKGDQIRQGVNWKQYGENYDAIFRNKEPIASVLLRFINDHLRYRGEYPVEIPITHDEFEMLRIIQGPVQQCFYGENKFAGYPLHVRTDAVELRTFGVREVK